MNKTNRTILTALILCSVFLLLFLLVSYQGQRKQDVTDQDTQAQNAETEDIEMKNIETEDMTAEGSSDVSELPEYTEETAQDIETVPNTETAETLPSEAGNEETESTQIQMTPSDQIIYAEGFSYETLSEEIIDRIYGISYKEDCPVPYEDLRYVQILYVDFNGETQQGELICNRSIAQDFVEIFYELYQQNYQLEQVTLIDEYQADDKLSMMHNNTSCFNYRTVEGTQNISKHGLGLAIDVNPFYNPYISTNADGSVYISPPGSEPYADRTAIFDHKIDKDDLCYQLFTQHGFLWGGNWIYTKDYQHFYKES